MPSNAAAWLTTEKAISLEVKPTDYVEPQPNEVLIKNGAVAINPIDWLIQSMGSALFALIKYPFILGSDVAGEVIKVGSDISKVKVGDRVIGHAHGFSNNNNAEGAFQTYTLLKSNQVSPIPDSLSLEQACVLPLGISTAACALYQKDYLALEPPSVHPKPTGKTLLIWAGSSSVGSNAIQLGVASGYGVITTASPRNFDYCKSLGASQVFDYSSSTLKKDLLGAFEGKTLGGAFAILPGSCEPCLEIASKIEGNKFVALAVPPPDVVPEGVSVKFVFGSTLKDNEVGSLIFEDFLPEALAQDKFVAAPEPLVVGKGLEFFQVALDKQREGVSAKKVVVSL